MENGDAEGYIVHGNGDLRKFINVIREEIK